MAVEYLRDHGIGHEIAAKYQLGFVNPADEEDRKYEGRLAIPYRTPDGGIVAMKYRCLEDHDCKEFNKTVQYEHAKYAIPFGQENWIFNSDAFLDADDTIGVAEGEIDSIVATEFLGLPTVGIPGVEIWTKERQIWRRTLDDYDKVIIFADGDPPSNVHPDGAGLEFARAVANDVKPRGYVVRCPRNEDVASMVASGRADELRAKAGLTNEQRAN